MSLCLNTTSCCTCQVSVALIGPLHRSHGGINHGRQVDGLQFDELEPHHSPSWTATLVVSLSDRSGKQKCGGLAVYPRSHWLMLDWILAKAVNEAFPPLPQPFDVPAAMPLELELGCGDAALLHPWLAYSIVPNASSTSAHLLILHLGKPSRSPHTLTESESMWRGWQLMGEPLKRELLTINQLQAKEHDSGCGSWATNTPDAPVKLSDLPFAVSSNVAHCDLMAWQLRASAKYFMQDGKWNEAMSMLQPLAGLRPNCYWTLLQAGQCSMLGAPAGQLRGRAGRKCLLEDGERFLIRAIESAPGWPPAYAELTKSLQLMGRGRELEVGEVVRMMKSRCNLTELCKQYPLASSTLQRSWDICDAAVSTNQCA
ncbi:unnamed protein product [Sphagnum troendelagicum]